MTPQRILAWSFIGYLTINWISHVAVWYNKPDPCLSAWNETWPAGVFLILLALLFVSLRFAYDMLLDIPPALNWIFTKLFFLYKENDANQMFRNHLWMDALIELTEAHNAQCTNPNDLRDIVIVIKQKKLITQETFDQYHKMWVDKVNSAWEKMVRNGGLEDEANR